MDHTLIGNLYKGIKESRKQRVLYCIVILTFIQAGITASISAFNFTIMKYVSEDNKYAVIKWITIVAGLQCIKQLIDYIRVVIYKKKIIIELNKYFKNKFLVTLLLQSNHDWLNCNKSSEINTAINSGTSALLATLRFMTDVINPLFQSIASICVVGSYVGSITMIAIVIMIGIFFGGSKLLLWEYHELGKANKSINPLSSYNVHLANTFMISLLNGHGKKTLDSILDKSTKKNELHTEISLKTQKGYKLLELIGIITIMSTVYLMSSESTAVLVAVNMNLNTIIDKMWWLFFMFHRASSNASDWATLEEYLKSVVSEHYKFKDCLKEYNISDDFPRSKEFQVVGKSGSGKSTWMLSEVINLFRQYDVDWMYLDQRMVIPKTSCITIREFTTAFIKDVNDSQILHWANILELDTVINRDTLDKSFITPSGGEEKRIIILQKFLPILIGEKTVKVIFADEITAGLDPNTQKIVRKLIELIKSRYGIIVVNIDHHKYTSDDLVRIGVVKEEVTTASYLTETYVEESKTCIDRMLKYFDFSHRYTKIKYEEKSIKYPPKVRLKKIEDFSMV